MTCSDLPAPRSPRYRSLDMWRGTACLMIVLIHAANDPTHVDGPSDLGWGAYAPRLTTYSLGLTHISALDERAARRIAPVLAAHLAR